MAAERIETETGNQRESRRSQEAVTIIFEVSPGTFSALRLSPKEFTREMRVAASVQWYAQGAISQGKAAEIADLSRGEFLEELFRWKVPVCQVTYEELIEEIGHA